MLCYFLRSHFSIEDANFRALSGTQALALSISCKYLGAFSYGLASIIFVVQLFKTADVPFIEL